MRLHGQVISSQQLAGIQARLETEPRVLEAAKSQAMRQFKASKELFDQHLGGYNPKVVAIIDSVTIEQLQVDLPLRVNVSLESNSSGVHLNATWEGFITIVQPGQSQTGPTCEVRFTMDELVELLAEDYFLVEQSDIEQDDLHREE